MAQSMGVDVFPEVCANRALPKNPPCLSRRETARLLFPPRTERDEKRLVHQSGMASNLDPFAERLARLSGTNSPTRIPVP